MMDFDQLFLSADCGYHFRCIIHRHYAIPKYKIDQKTIFVGGFNETQKPIEFRAESIHLHDFFTALRFIRVFGSVISKLTITDNLEPHEYLLIGEYLNEYVVDALEILRLRIQNDGMIQTWRKPFKDVTKLDITVEPMEKEKICHLNHFFPNLRILRMKWHANIYPKCLNQNFTDLKQLHYGDDTESDASIRYFIAANGQLDSLHIENQCDAPFVRFLNDRVPELQTLTMLHLKNDFFMKNAAEFRTAHFVHLKKLRIVLTTGGAKIIQHFPFDFERLEELELVERHTMNKWVEFISQQKGLRKLRIASDGWTSDEWRFIGAKLEYLNDLSVIYRFQSSDGLFHLIRHSRNLQKVMFQIRFAQQQQRVKELMPRGWNVTIENEPYPYDLVFVKG